MSHPSSLRYASLCTGISCESVAWMPLGWRPVFFSEIDPFACAVLAHHYSDTPNLGDMTKIDGRDLHGAVDVMIAGTPCQSFSVAGKRGSLADARGNLALVYGRIVNDADVPVSIWENVPGVLSTRDNAFGRFLGEIVGAGGPLESGRPKGAWPGAGVAAGPRRVAAWRILDARYLGVAQRRRRVFVVSVRAGGGANPCEVLLEPESLPRDSAPGEEAETDVARSLTGSTGGASAKEQQLTFVSGAGEPLNALPGKEPSCTAHHHDGAKGRRALSRNHEAPIAFSAKDCGGDAGRESPTLRAMPHESSHMNGGGQVAVAHTLRGEGHDASEDGTGRGVPLTPALRGRADGGGASRAVETAVRRLTPREVLQGLPPDYTLIAYGRGGRRKDIAEMAAYWGVSEEDATALAADSHRYRAIGNGMAAPVVRWIGRRIEWVFGLTGFRIDREGARQ